MIQLEILGERLVLLPQCALFWEREKTLFIADTHFGKPETFRAAAMPVPGGSTANALARLDDALQTTAARNLTILGDFWHSRAGKSAGLLAEIGAWRARWPELEIDLVLGNHDRGTGGVPAEWNFHVHARPLQRLPFLLCHHPQDSDDGYVLAGHLHPAVALRGKGRQRLRLPAFWFGPRVGVLPAFGEFTGNAFAEPPANARVFAVAGTEIIECPERG